MAWGAIIAAAGAAFSVMSGKAGARRAERIGKANAQFIMEEGMEQSRRLRREIQTAQSSITAGSGASGLDPSSKSFEAFKQAQLDEGNKQLRWINKSSRTRQIAAKAGSQSAAASAMNAGISGAIGSIAAGFGGS